MSDYQWVTNTPVVPSRLWDMDTERPNDFFDCFSKMFMQNGFNSLPLRQASAVCKMMLM